MASFVLVVKPTTGGDKFSVDVTSSMTVVELKEQVQTKTDIPSAEQRLIYKGQVLKDERTVDSYGRVACRSVVVDPDHSAGIGFSIRGCAQA